MNSNDSFGLSGERAAEDFLRAAGLRIVARRWRTRTGEIDLIAMDGDEVVFIEVKARRTAAFGPPEEAVTRAKRDHLRAAAAAWLEAKRPAGAPFRIDVVAVEPAIGGPPRVTHIRSAVAERD